MLGMLHIINPLPEYFNYKCVVWFIPALDYIYFVSGFYSLGVEIISSNKMNLSEMSSNMKHQTEMDIKACPISSNLVFSQHRNLKILKDLK